jgi:hypothetical protein
LAPADAYATLTRKRLQEANLMTTRDRVRFRHRLAMLSAAASLVLTTAVAAVPAQAENPRAGDCVQDGSVQTGAIFNNPHTGDADRIHQHIGCLIDGAPQGSKINIATYHFADSIITEAVMNAIRRGVQVRILVDSGVPDNAEDGAHYQQVKDLIAAEDAGGSWIRPCPGSDRACIGNRRMHNKLLTLSEAHGSIDVSFLTSSNFEDAGVDNDGKGNSGTDMWNSGYTAANDGPLYSWFADTYFENLSAPAPQNLEYYEQAGLPREIGAYQVHHSPRASGNTALDVLDRVDCNNEGTGGTNPGNRTIVRVGMWAITATGGIGNAIADRLWELDNEGCYVDVVADVISYDKDDPTAYGPLRTLLKRPEPTAAGGGLNYHGPEVREFNGDQPHGLHQKNLMIDGRFDDRNDQKVVFTGSYNFTQSSAGDSSSHTVNDETWLQINDAGVHDRFVENFQQVRYAAHTCWQTSKVAGCDGGRVIEPDSTGSLDCHETADKYRGAGNIYLYRGTYCSGGHDAKDDSAEDSDHGDGAGQITDFDNRADSIINTTDKHVEFFNYPDYNRGYPEGDSFCLRPDAWVNQISKYGDGHQSWSNSISSHRLVDDPERECDRWFGGYHEPNRINR